MWDGESGSQLTGWVAFADGHEGEDGCPVERAVLREGSFAIDFVWQGGTYSAILRRDEDGWFRGRWSRRSPFPAEGKAACLFRDGDDHVKLLGFLTEEQREWLWVGMLEPVSRET